MKTRFFCLFLFIIVKSYAQEEPHFTMYWNNYSSYNPAATGLFNTHYGALNGRTQWLGIPGNPRDLNLLYDLKVTRINSGVGVNFLVGSIGEASSKRINFNYAYHIKLGKERVLSTGTAVSFINRKIDYSMVTSDPLFSNSISENFIDFNIGTMYKSNRMLIGFSTTYLTESSRSFFHNSRHYFLNFSYDILLSDNFSIRPGFLFKKNGIYYDGTFNVRAYYKKRYWAGINTNIDFSVNGGIRYLNVDYIGPMVGVDIAQKVRIGYAFDYHLSTGWRSNNTSHEIVLALMFK